MAVTQHNTETTLGQLDFGELIAVGILILGGFVGAVVILLRLL